MAKGEEAVVVPARKGVTIYRNGVSVLLHILEA